jgi:hypothetical protein
LAPNFSKEQMMKKVFAVLASLALVLSITSGAGAAAKRLITGKDIKNGSITTVDLSKRTVAQLKGAKGAKGAKGDTGAAGAKGETGAPGTPGVAGAKGDKGEKGDPGADGRNGVDGQDGDQGEKGDPGQALVANVTTDPNPGLGGKPAVLLLGQDADGTAPDATTKGTSVASVTLDAGTYLVNGTVQFFNLNPNAAADGRYGVAQIFVGGDPVGGQLWSGPIAESSKRLAQTQGTGVVTVPADGTVVSLNAVSRGGTGSSIGGVWAGGNLIVTKLATP